MSFSWVSLARDSFSGTDLLVVLVYGHVALLFNYYQLIVIISRGGRICVNNLTKLSHTHTQGAVCERISRPPR